MLPLVFKNKQQAALRINGERLIHIRNISHPLKRRDLKHFQLPKKSLLSKLRERLIVFTLIAAVDARICVLRDLYGLVGKTYR